MIGLMSSTLTASQISNVVAILYKARTDQQVKLRFGARKRLAILKAIRDETVNKDDYRYQWIKTTRDKILKLLSVESAAFNQTYGHDAISLEDMVDVAESVAILLRNYD